ncbi:hypothetical protein HMPREF3193_01418 [Bifidobacterium breve]|nr:hypothetical protein HMPREF1587_00673 [Bifidobacterium breve JCP7499]KWZ84656.1 hypothetical protein HMPREF3193_01418 [Bifidobacterium breve]
MVAAQVNGCRCVMVAVSPVDCRRRQGRYDCNRMRAICMV